MRYFTFYFALFLTLGLFSQSENSFSLTLSGATGADQTIIRYESNATNDVDMGLDLMKVFPSDANAPVIFTVDENELAYSVNTMNSSSVEDTVVPVYIQNAIAGTYTVVVSDIAPLEDQVECYLVIPSLEDTITYNGSTTFTITLTANPNYDFNTPAIVFHIGKAYDLDLYSVSHTNASCSNSMDGKLFVDGAFSNTLIEVLDNQGTLINSLWSDPGVNEIDSLSKGEYLVRLSKGVSMSEFLVDVEATIDEVFEIDLINMDPYDLNVELDVLNPNYDFLEWDFGDGHSSNIAYSIHQYDSSINYMVNLHVETGNCIFKDSLEVNFSDFLGVNGKNSKEEEIDFHYSKAHGLVLFNKQQRIEEFQFFSLDGKLIEQGKQDMNSHEYIGSPLILKYKQQGQEKWKTSKLVVID